ncbi:translation factor Sua5 [Platysternon megacephalum]|uniref:Translation factor Sua5 n=1 Tax=Platysternon megacephalum TaxID=55544 RepID=A0A4D9DE42_9SAUR|nr:translation factor Sua5 [Platysternon megacephalum]
MADVEQEMEDDSAEQEGAASEVVESPRSARTRSLSRHSSAMSAQYSEQSGRKLMKEAVEREAELDGGAVIGEVGDSEEEEMTEEEAETEEPESDGKNALMFVVEVSWRGCPWGLSIDCGRVLVTILPPMLSTRFHSRIMSS